MAARPLRRSVKLYGLHDVILDGRYVMAPAVGYRANWGSFPSAEKAFASIVAGTVEEYETNIRLGLKTALRLAVLNTEYDPEFYLVRSTEGTNHGQASTNPTLIFNSGKLKINAVIKKTNIDGILVFRHKVVESGYRVIRDAGSNEWKAISPYLLNLRDLENWLAGNGMRMVGKWLW